MNTSAPFTNQYCRDQVGHPQVTARFRAGQPSELAPALHLASRLVDPADRRWVVAGGAISLVGAIALVVLLTTTKVSSLAETDFVAFLFTTVFGLALIAAAGARDALLGERDTKVLILAHSSRNASRNEGDLSRKSERLKVHTVYRNRPEGLAFRTRYEVALLAREPVEALRIEAQALSVVGVRVDLSAATRQDAGHRAGMAWSTLWDPPFVFCFDVLTYSPEDTINISGSTF